ncbi:hypothetical protein Ancab_002663 [Ancistrocladus abbreviatus]
MGSCASIYRNSESASKQLHMSFVPSKFEPSTSVKTASVAQVSPINSATAFRCQSSAGTKEETFFDSQAWLESDCDDDFYSVNGDFTPSRGSPPVHGSAAGSPRVNKTFSLQANRALFEGRTPLNSESTKSHGSIPLHHSVSAEAGAPLASEAMEGKAFGCNTNASSSSASSLDKKKKLVDLFRESRGGGYDESLPISGYLSENDACRKLEMKPNVPRSAYGASYLYDSKSFSSGERTPLVDDSGKEKLLKSAKCCFPRLVPSRSFHERKKATTAPTIVDA